MSTPQERAQDVVVQYRESGISVLLEDHIAAAIRDAEARGLREAAYISDNFSKGYEISWWRKQTKGSIAETLCRDVAEKLREKAKEREQ
jgi:hypothetical protein